MFRKGNIFRGYYKTMNFSNHSFLLGAIYEMTSAGLSSVRFVTWRPAVALTWESLSAIAGSSFRRVDKC